MPKLLERHSEEDHFDLWAREMRRRYGWHLDNLLRDLGNVLPGRPGPESKPAPEKKPWWRR